MIFIAKQVKDKIFIRDIKIKLEEINSQFRNKKELSTSIRTQSKKITQSHRVIFFAYISPIIQVTICVILNIKGRG